LRGILDRKELETDTHWRCRAKGSFNWRWKFPLTLPLDEDDDYGKDMLTIQMWDRDIVGSNDLIGEFKMFLNDPTYPMLSKAYKRKERVVMRKMDTKKKKLLERFWISFTHPEQVDAENNCLPQGFAEVSIEILPKKLADS
jgi:hypothetical protein